MRTWTSPCAQRGRPRAHSVRVPMRAARRGRRALPADASRPPAGAARAHGGHGDICGRGRRPRRPASPGTSPCARHGRPLRAARRGRRALPAGASRSPAGAARAHGGHGDICGRGRRPRRPASTGTSPCAHGRPRAHSVGVPVRTACASPCARRAEDVAPYQPTHPGPPPGRHGRMAATGTFVVGADVPGGPRPPGRPHARMDVPVRAACASRARGAPRTSRPTSRASRSPLP